MNSSLSPQEAADRLLMRRRIRRKFSEWTRHNGFEPAAHHRLLMSKLVKVSRGSIPRLAVPGRRWARSWRLVGEAPVCAMVGSASRARAQGRLIDCPVFVGWHQRRQHRFPQSIQQYANVDCPLSTYFPVNRSGEISAILIRFRPRF